MAFRLGPSVPEGFRACFPVLSWWIGRPLLVLVVAALVAAGTGFFFGLPAGLGVVCLATPLLGLALEKNLIGRILLPPFTVWAFWSGLGTGLGVPILVLSPGEIPIPSYLKIQLVYLASFPIAAGAYFWAARKVLSTEGIPGAWDRIAQNPGKNTLLLGWVWFAVSVVAIVVRCGLGLEDRGPANPRYGPGWDPYGWMMFLSIFPRIDLLGFFFLPLLWSRAAAPGKFVLSVLTLAALAMALPSGARGILFYPACFALAGGYFFRSKNRAVFEKAAAGIALICLVLVYVLLAFRANPSYQQASSFREKSRALCTALLQLQPDATIFHTCGYSLFGFEDAKVYTQVPQNLPYAGAEGFEAIPYTWIPTYFLREKPSLLDGASVAGAVQLPPMKELRGYGISLPADAYRRFGWAGILPVIGGYFLLYGLVARYLLNPAGKGPLYAAACGLFGMSFFMSHPFATLLTSWHTFLYSLPKNFLPVWLACRLLDRGRPSER